MHGGNMYTPPTYWVNRKSGRAMLKAVFNFEREVNQENREEIRKRTEESELHKYLSKMGWVEVGGAARKRESNNDLYLAIIPHLFGFGFTVEVESDELMPLNEMLDLEGLKRFVLTGKYSEKSGDRG